MFLVCLLLVGETGADDVPACSGTVHDASAGEIKHCSSLRRMTRPAEQDKRDTRRQLLLRQRQNITTKSDEYNSIRRVPPQAVRQNRNVYFFFFVTRVPAVSFFCGSALVF